MKTNKQQHVDPSADALRAVLGSRTVSYQSVFAKAFGSVTSAVFLSQAFFWQENAQHKDLKIVEGKAFFDKTIAEWYDATGVTEEQQKGARAILRKHGVLLECKIGVPARLHYHIDFNALVAVISGYKKDGKPVTAKPGGKKRYNARASSGKFRPQEAVKPGDINKGEFREFREFFLRGEKRKKIAFLIGSKIKKRKARIALKIEGALKMIDADLIEAEMPKKDTPGGAAKIESLNPVFDATEIAMRYFQEYPSHVKGWFEVAMTPTPATVAEFKSDVMGFFSYWSDKEGVNIERDALKLFTKKYYLWLKKGKSISQNQQKQSYAKPDTDPQTVLNESIKRSIEYSIARRNQREAGNNQGGL